MLSVSFSSPEFPVDPDDDLDPAVAHWVRAVLLSAGIAAREPVRKEYGWSICLENPATVWVAVEAAQPDWEVAVMHEIPVYAPWRWFRPGAGRALERRAFEAIRAAVEARPGMVIESVYS